MSRPDLARLLPGLWRLRRYERSWFRGDVLAGVTVAAYLVPQVMAYAVLVALLVGSASSERLSSTPGSERVDYRVRPPAARRGAFVGVATT